MSNTACNIVGTVPYGSNLVDIYIIIPCLTHVMHTHIWLCVVQSQFLNCSSEGACLCKETFHV